MKCQHKRASAIAFGSAYIIEPRNHAQQCNVPEDLAPVQSVSAGGSHTCVIVGATPELARLRCFGSNKSRQCDVPKDLEDVPVKAVAAGGSHTCVITQSFLAAKSRKEVFLLFSAL